MATFPKQETQVAGLAQTMVSGFDDNIVVYPMPPIATVDMTALMNAYTAAKNASVAAAAAAEAATTAKMDALEEMVAAMKSDLRYAENTVDYDDEKLKLLGWAGRKEPSPLAAPGQTLLLNVIKQGEGWVELEWKAPADGGKPSAYKVTRRERPAGAWQEVHAAVTTEGTLVDQPRGKELEYRIIAVNKAGEGEPSNTEMVVL
jgi:Fibronectin type III domain